MNGFLSLRVGELNCRQACMHVYDADGRSDSLGDMVGHGDTSQIRR